MQTMHLNSTKLQARLRTFGEWKITFVLGINNVMLAIPRVVELKDFTPREVKKLETVLEHLSRFHESIWLSTSLPTQTSGAPQVLIEHLESLLNNQFPEVHKSLRARFPNLL